MNWYRRVKLASVEYLYHGTAIQNIPTILSEGLTLDHELTFDQDLTFESIRSYGGIYFSNNLMTAISVGGTSSAKRGNRSVKGIVVAKLETQSPHITVDEDSLPSFLYPLQDVTKLVLDKGSWPEHLAYFLSDGLDSAMPQMVEFYKDLLRQMLNVNDERYLSYLDPHIEAVLQAYLLNLLAAQIGSYYQGSTEYQKKYFEEKFPQFAGLEVPQTEANFREAADSFLMKAHRLTEFSRDKVIDYKIRSTQPISFRGANRIVGIAEWQDRLGLEDQSDYYVTIDFKYLSDDSFMDNFIEQVRQRWSDNFKVTAKGQTYYDNPYQRA